MNVSRLLRSVGIPERCPNIDNSLYSLTEHVIVDLQYVQLNGHILVKLLLGVYYGVIA